MSFQSSTNIQYTISLFTKWYIKGIGIASLSGAHWSSIRLPQLQTNKWGYATVAAAVAYVNRWWTLLKLLLPLFYIQIHTYLGCHPSIRDRVHRNENFAEIIPVFSTFFNFFKKKKKKIIKAILCNFSMRLLKYF